MAESAIPGMVVLAATPLGNDQDASPRLCELLASADLIAAEDTRRLRRLVGGLGIEVSGRVVSYHDANERERAIELVDHAAAGGIVLVVTDAGVSLFLQEPGDRLPNEFDWTKSGGVVSQPSVPASAPKGGTPCTLSDDWVVALK